MMNKDFNKHHEVVPLLFSSTSTALMSQSTDNWNFIQLCTLKRTYLRTAGKKRMFRLLDHHSYECFLNNFEPVNFEILVQCSTDGALDLTWGWSFYDFVINLLRMSI